MAPQRAAKKLRVELAIEDDCLDVVAVQGGLEGSSEGATTPRRS